MALEVRIAFYSDVLKVIKNGHL